MQNKKQTISYIKKLIKENGSFSIGEIDGIEWLPAVNEMGKLVALAEHFYEDHVEVNIYNPSNYLNDPIANPYHLTYEELSPELLNKIEDLCNCWDAQKMETKNNNF
jgi:hypothetical protein